MGWRSDVDSLPLHFKVNLTISITRWLVGFYFKSDKLNVWARERLVF